MSTPSVVPSLSLPTAAALSERSAAADATGAPQYASEVHPGVYIATLSGRGADATDGGIADDGCTGGTADMRGSLSGGWLKAKNCARGVVMLQELSGDSKPDKAGAPADIKSEGLKRDMEELLEYIEDTSPEHVEVVAEPCVTSPKAAGEKELTGLEWAKAFGGAEGGEADDAWAKETANELQSGPLRLHSVAEGAEETAAVPQWEDEGSEPQRDKLGGNAGPPAGGGGAAGMNIQGRRKKSTGCCVPRRRPLSQPSTARAEELFQRLMTGGRGKVRREEALRLFQTCFGEDAEDILQLTTSGFMTAPEFVDVCNRVKMAGYSDDEILDQLEANYTSYDEDA